MTNDSRSRSRSPVAKKRRRRRGRRNRKRKTYKNDENSEEEGLGAGPGWTAPRGRGTFVPRGRGFIPRGPSRGRGGRGRGGNGGSGLRGRGYWRPNYVAYGRNIFPGGGESSDDSYSSRSRSSRSYSSSRSSTPDNYKNTPEKDKKHGSVTPPPSKLELKEKGLMERLNENVSSDRLQTILNQLENSNVHEPQTRGEFVPTLRESKDMFDSVEAPPLRKEFNVKDDEEFKSSPIPFKTEPNTPKTVKPRLFDYEPVQLPNLDHQFSLRKQMELKENQDKLRLEADRKKDQNEQNDRIKSRIQDIKCENNQEDLDGASSLSILSRRRVSGQMRTTTDEPDEKMDLTPLKEKNEDDDAEFIKNLNNSFNKERGIVAPIVEPGTMTFSQLSSAAKSRGKFISTKGPKFSLTKVLKPRVPTFPKPSDDVTTSMGPAMNNYPPEATTSFNTDILSNAPLLDENIGPKKPIMSIPLSGKRSTTGVVIPASLQTSNTPTPPLTNDDHIPDFKMTTSQPDPGSSGANISHQHTHSSNGMVSDNVQNIPLNDIRNKNNFHESQMAPRPPQMHNRPPPVLTSFPPPPIVSPGQRFNGPSGQGYNGPPPVIPGTHSMPPPVVMHTPNYQRMIPTVPTPTVTIRREYSIPVRHSQPQHHFQGSDQPQLFHSTRPAVSTSFDQITAPPTNENHLDIKQEIKEDKRDKINKLYVLYPTIWQGFVSIKKQVAMVQLHHISGNQHIAKSVLPKDLSVPSSDGSNHPALRVTSRVKLDDLTIGQVMKRWKESSHKCCFMVALPCGVCQADTEKQTTSLKSSFMNYFNEKKAAGSLVIKSNSSSWLVYMFPPCDFVESHLSENAPDLKRNISDLPKLLIAIIPKEK